MKKKIIIVFGIISAFCLIGLGVNLKMKQGYTLSTDQEIIDVMGDIVNNEPYAVELLKKRIYKNDEYQLMLVVVRSRGENILQIFKENQSHRYEEYYNYIIGQDTALTLIDSYHNATYFICENELHKIDGYIIFTEKEAGKIKPLTDKENYIIECFDTDDETISISPIDENGEVIENFAYAQDNIR